MGITIITCVFTSPRLYSVTSAQIKAAFKYDLMREVQIRVCEHALMTALEIDEEIDEVYREKAG